MESIIHPTFTRGKRVWKEFFPFHTNVLREPDFLESYCRAGVSPAIKRFTLAGETPALHSEVTRLDYGADVLRLWCEHGGVADTEKTTELAKKYRLQPFLLMATAGN